ncbi:MAG: hypothetical protein FLDDKLPJ_00599 [Phycisphaerae bacterium]|nr:hypothetical protein [Phycisphaerae bacterium]
MRSRVTTVRLILVAALVGPTVGCNSILNEWLNPSIPGNFRENRTMSIRTALTVEDVPGTIPGATEPTHDDLVPKPVSYRLGPGDIVAVEIEELRQVGVPWQGRFQVSEVGELPLPVVGRLKVAGMTPLQIEDRIRERLIEDQVLTDPKVLVLPLDVYEAKYMLFGVGVSASDNSPLRAGRISIVRPDLDVLEAINDVGGLNEFVTEVYIFRQEPPVDRREASETPSGSEATREEEEEAPLDTTAPSAEPEKSAEEELLEAVIAQNTAAGQGDKAAPPGGPPQDAADVTRSGDSDADVAPDTLYIYQDGAFIPNPERAAEGDDRPRSVPVERLPLYEAIQSTVDWSRIAGETSYRIIRIPAEALRAGDPEYKVIVRPGDVIRIVSGEIGVYYVMGQVGRTGPFTFNSEQVTLKSAIAAAGGLGPLAWPTNCTIYRRHGLREQMIQVDLDAIFAGKEDDVTVLRGDIINVGTSPFAPWLARLRALTLPNPTATVGYAFTYSRNFADIDSFAVQPNPATRPSKFEQLFP